MTKEAQLKIWFDTEFIEDGRTIDLLSVGMVREDGATYYAESIECDQRRACKWVQAHVLPRLSGPRISRDEIRFEVRQFCFGLTRPEFWAYYGAYDWVALCQLFGRMIEIPSDWPMCCLDVRQLALSVVEPWPLPPHIGRRHHALDDALWCKQAYDYVMGVKNAKS